MLSNIISVYGLYILILIFIMINIYYKNIINILTFVISLLALRTYFDDTNSIIGAYAISVLYGISKNFHLLENFQSVKSNDKPITKNNIVKLLNNLTDVDNDNEITISDIKNMVKKNLNKDNLKSLLDDSNNIIKQTNDTIDSINNLKRKLKPTKQTNNVSSPKRKNNVKTISVNPVPTPTPTTVSTSIPELDSIISEELINQFINKLKMDDNLLITNTKANIYDLKPTLAKISNNKINKLVKLANEKNNLFNKPIVISKDNFIIDGHHRWYARKYMVENNTNSYNTDFYSEDIKVIIIDYHIKKLIEKLQEYKINFNRDYLSQALLNLKTNDNGRNFMNQIQNDNIVDETNTQNKIKKIKKLKKNKKNQKKKTKNTKN